MIVVQKNPIMLPSVNGLYSFSLRKGEAAVDSRATVHAKAEEQRMRVAVTIVVYLYGCFMAIYLSRCIRARCNSDALTNTVSTALDSCLMKQCVLEVPACKFTMHTAMKVGCPITPMNKSVVAKHARAILDMVLNRGFVFTAIMTSPFNKLVTGDVIIFVISKIRVAAGACVKFKSTICPSQDALEFIFFQCCAETRFSR